jgi:hypothetical protein
VQSRRDQPADGVAVAADRHRSSDAEREPDHAAGMGLSFFLVGVEDLRRHAAVQYGGQLPRQVHRVAQSGTHALADERGGEVSGVAEQKDPAAPPTVGQRRTERVFGDSDQLQLWGGHLAQPWPNQLGEGVEGREVRGGLAVTESKLPPVAPVTDAHIGACTVRVAHLMDAVPLAEVSRGRDISDDPALFEREIAHARADSAAHEAAGSVASEYVVGHHEVFGPVISIRVADPDAAVSIGDIGDFDVAAQYCARVPRQIEAQ